MEKKQLYLEEIEKKCQNEIVVAGSMSMLDEIGYIEFAHLNWRANVPF